MYRFKKGEMARIKQGVTKAELQSALDNEQLDWARGKVVKVAGYDNEDVLIDFGKDCDAYPDWLWNGGGKLPTDTGLWVIPSALEPIESDEI